MISSYSQIAPSRPKPMLDACLALSGPLPPASIGPDVPIFNSFPIVTAIFNDACVRPCRRSPTNGAGPRVSAAG